MVTAALGNVSPLFAVLLAVVLLNEPLRLWQFVGLLLIVAGVLVITVTRGAGARDWRTWALLLPLGAAVLRGLMPPVIKLGLEIWPSAIAACLTGYIVSTLTVLMVEKVRNGALHRARAARRAAVVRLYRNLQRPRHAAAVCRARPRPGRGGGAAGRDLSDDHGRS